MVVLLNQRNETKYERLSKRWRLNVWPCSLWYVIAVRSLLFNAGVLSEWQSSRLWQRFAFLKVENFKRHGSPNMDNASSRKTKHKTKEHSSVWLKSWGTFTSFSMLIILWSCYPSLSLYFDIRLDFINLISRSATDHQLLSDFSLSFFRGRVRLYPEKQTACCK